MKKIIILGCPGSGKSTLARILHDKTGIPLYPLDRIWWRSDRTHISRAEFDAKLDEILKTDSWILDGDYSRTYEVRIQACDTVIFLDYEVSLCIEGITQRVGNNRDDCPFHENTLDLELLNEVHKYRSEKRPVVMKLLEQHAEKNIFIFHNRAQTENWLSEAPRWR